MKKLLLSVLIVCSILVANSHAEKSFPVAAKRVLFLGDSITHAGHYIALIEANLYVTDPENVPELINLGLPSETCSGMSEPIHPFPRPNVHERLERALTKLKPDVVVACYGMNDGIYHPPNDERLDAYKKGITSIISKVRASGAKLVLMTPPAFDALPLKKKGQLRPIGADEYSWKTIYENYDDVIKQYGQYVKSQADKVDMVIDLHGPVSDYVSKKRETNPDFSMSPDGVHVNHEGHEVLASAILRAWEIKESELPPNLMSLINKRQQIMHAAWVSHVGHKRPGVKPGLPIDEALAMAKQLSEKIEKSTTTAIEAAN